MQTAPQFMAEAKYVSHWHHLPLVARNIRQRNRTVTSFTHFLQFLVFVLLVKSYFYQGLTREWKSGIKIWNEKIHLSKPIQVQTTCREDDTPQFLAAFSRRLSCGKIPCFSPVEIFLVHCPNYYPDFRNHIYLGRHSKRKAVQWPGREPGQDFVSANHINPAMDHRLRRCVC